VFGGFVYVGSGVNPRSHSNSGLEVPTPLKPDREYVFHHTKPFDSLEFASLVLPERLEALGYSLTDPLDPRKVGYIDPGGALWGVRFIRGACSGLIYTRRCLDITSRSPLRDLRMTESDFVLTLHGQCTN
jgi:hypothetical protein